MTNPITPPAYQPEPESTAIQLAARPLLGKVSRMADCIDQRTVGEIMVISSRATAWLEANPPGQPVAIEPLGCPTPGACSCVEPVAQPEPVAPTRGEAVAVYTEVMAAHGCETLGDMAEHFARAVLARWGSHS
jgi:hypothetical protein